MNRESKRIAATRIPRRRYKPTAFDLNDSIRAILEEESVEECGDVLRRLEAKHKDWNVNERRVAKFVKRLNSSQQHIILRNDDNQTEVSSLTISIASRRSPFVESSSAGGSNFFRKVLQPHHQRSNNNSNNNNCSNTTPLDATIDVVREEEEDCFEDSRLLRNGFLGSIYLDDSKLNPMFLDESNQDPKERSTGCWCMVAS
ncbi:hypothetical protein ACA910_021423 [Epithemia clementina (nom. ined.)]